MDCVDLDLESLLGNGSPEEMEKALTWCELIDEYDQGSIQAQDTLVMCMLDLIGRPGSKEALGSVIDLSKKLYELDATNGDSRLRNRRANNYAVAISHRYWKEGEPEDLHESVRLSEEAVSASPQAMSILNNPEGTILQHPELEIHTLNTLGARLDERFQLTGSLDDLNRSITIMEKLVSAIPQEDWKNSRAEWLVNLAASLQRRYEQDESDSQTDIDKAIELSREALRLTNGDDMRKATILCTLANALGGRAGGAEQMKGLDEAIMQLREARNIVSVGHERQIEIGVNLAMRLFQKSEMNKVESELKRDLDEAIGIATSTLSGTPDDHPSQAHLRNFLGLFNYAIFRRSLLESNAKKALAHFWEALRSPHYPSVFRRVQAGRMILHLCCTTSNWHEAYEAASIAVGLIPKLSSRAIRNSDKQRVLSADDVVGFGADAAAAALNAGKDGYVALRLLETGRGSLAASVAELRPDIIALRREHAALAQRFVELRDELEIISSGIHSASSKFDALVDEIRRKQGFQGFLKPPSDGDVHEAACDGPIVVLTASVYRGVDAILVERDQIRVLTLEKVTTEDLERWSGKLASAALLEWLWDFIVKPILDELHLTWPPPNGPLPRIWWIPTGILSKFPLHAAGRHSVGSTESVIDVAVSSYSLSIKALLDARRHPSSPPRPKESKVLLVDMANTPDCSPLRYTTEEVSMVKGLFTSGGFDSISLSGDEARKPDVLQYLKSCKMFHFAGHGFEDKSDPLRSALLLHDWKADRMTVGNVLDVNLSENKPFLAYLAACETGQVTKSKFYDESIHLISAYQLAGFRHVIGTLWSVDDNVSAFMAKVTYENLVKDMRSELVARSLHNAARERRDEVRCSKKDKKKDQNDERNLKLVNPDEDQSDQGGKGWIPFVHYGV